jgi:hypothetical protein
MPAGKYSFSIDQGSTFTIGVQYLDSNEVPIDLTGYHGRMQIRSDYADNTNTLYVTVSSSFDTDGTGLNFNGLYGNQPLTSGSIGITISADKTTSMSFDEGYYDLELYSGSFVTRILEGIVLINKEVTRV